MLHTQNVRLYVQDERYIAIEHMDVRRDCVKPAHCVIRRTVMFRIMFRIMFRMNGMPRAHGSAGAACVNFAQRFLICMGAKVVQCLVS